MAAERLAALALLALWVFPAWACRCAPQTLAEYFAAADVVAEVEIGDVVAGPADGQMRASLRLLRDFKNAAGLRGLRTAADGAACGLAVEPGQRYWIFGRLDPGSREPRVGLCDGSRMLARDFPDVPATQAADALQALSGGLDCPAPSPLEIASRITLGAVTRDRASFEGAVLAPNGAYRFVLDVPAVIQRPPRVTRLRVDHEQDALLQASFHGAGAPVHASWVNEKLILLQVPWSPALRSELLLDVEAQRWLAVETLLIDADGTDAWLDPRCGAEGR